MENHALQLKALADPVRLRILEFLLEPLSSCCSREDGVCACDLETFLGLSQPTVSHHMKQLVQAGLVRADKRGRWVYYELEPVAFAALAGEMMRLAGAKDATTLKDHPKEHARVPSRA